MAELFPDWIKALIGTGLMLFIGVYGFKLTSKASKGNDKNNTPKE